MKTYKQTASGGYEIDGRHISKSKTSRRHRAMLAEVAAGDAQILEYVAPAPTFEQLNATGLRGLLDIDARSIRALREGDSARIADLETEAQAIRDAFVTP